MLLGLVKGNAPPPSTLGGIAPPPGGPPPPQQPQQQQQPPPGPLMGMGPPGGLWCLGVVPLCGRLQMYTDEHARSTYNLRRTVGGNRS